MDLFWAMKLLKSEIVNADKKYENKKNSII